jgi:glycosyltransferase involved in cell wall biosynthesis
MARVAMLVSNGHAPDPRVEKEAEALAAAGHDVTVYAFDRSREGHALEPTGPVRVERVSPPAALPSNMLAVRAGLAYFHAAVRRRLLRAPADVVHCHDQDTCAVGLWWKRRGARRAGLARGRFVFDAHDLYWTWALLPRPDARWRRVLAAALRKNDRRFARAADLVITTTDGRAGARPGFAELYREWGCCPVTIWNSPPAPAVVPPLPSRFTLGYVGSVREPLMFQQLVDAIALLPREERPALRIAGGGRSAEHVRRLVGDASPRLGIEATVTGAFHSASIPRLMADVSVQFCVYPTRRGNIDRAMPVKLFESVVHGRRVIGNAGTLMGEWIRRYDWGWEVPHGNVRALADAIRAAATACAADGGRPASLRLPPSWPEQATVLAQAYQAMLAT